MTYLLCMRIQNRLYEAKDLFGFLHLKPEKIYLWLRTYKIFEPAERPQGVRGKNKYSLLDLVKLTLIAHLTNLGMHLDYVRGIFSEIDKADVWKRIINERDRFDTDAAILVIFGQTEVDWYRLEGGIGPARPRQAPRFRVTLLTYAEALRQLQERLKEPWPTLAINMNFIVEAVETNTGEKLGQRNTGKMTKS
jgi:hypothetical protein